MTVAPIYVKGAGTTEKKSIVNKKQVYHTTIRPISFGRDSTMLHSARQYLKNHLTTSCVVKSGSGPILTWNRKRRDWLYNEIHSQSFLAVVKK